MNAFQKKITLRVLGIHVAVIFLVGIVPLMRGCFTPKPKELITFIEMGGPAPQVNVESVSQLPDPEPPAPEPPPERIPEPVKKKPVPIKKKPEPIKKKPEPVKKPKQRLARPEDIKIGPKVKSTPKKPMVSERDIKNAMEGITSPSAQASGSPSEFNAYIGSIGIYFRRYWTPPPSASSASGVAVVRISIRKNGQITKRVKIQSSGDSLYDKTVMDAVNSVSTVPAPPANYPYGYVEVEFRLGE